MLRRRRPHIRGVSGPPVIPDPVFLPLNSPSTVTYNNPRPARYTLPQVWINSKYGQTDIFNPNYIPIDWNDPNNLDTLLSFSGNVTTDTNTLRNAIVTARARNGHTRLRLVSNFRARGGISMLKHNIFGFQTYVEWEDLDGLPEGVYPTPAQLANAPVIEAINGVIGLDCGENGVDGYRFSGIQFLFEDPAGEVSNLAYIHAPGTHSGQPSTIQPSSIGFDRCLFGMVDQVNAGANGVQHAMGMHGIGIYCVDSYFDNIYARLTETHNWALYDGKGPIKVVGNYTNGGGLAFLIGGVNPPVVDGASQITADVEFRRNHIFLPDSWNPFDSTWDQFSRSIKARIDIKFARRVLFEGNFISGAWKDGQDGVVFLLKASNQGGGNDSGADAICKDITVRYNWTERNSYLTNIASLAQPPINDPDSLERIELQHNVNCDWGTTLFSGPSPSVNVQIAGGHTKRVALDHNTLVTTLAPAPANINNFIRCASVQQGPMGPNIDITNNIGHKGTYGVLGDSTADGTGGSPPDPPLPAEGTNTMNSYFQEGYSFLKNLIIGSVNLANYPATTMTVGTVNGVDFVDAANKNFRLLPSSPGYQAATDGTDLGANIDDVELAISGVI